MDAWRARPIFGIFLLPMIDAFYSLENVRTNAFYGTHYPLRSGPVVAASHLDRKHVA